MSKIIIPFMKEKRADWIMPEKPFHAHEDDRGFEKIFGSIKGK